MVEPRCWRWWTDWNWRLENQGVGEGGVTGTGDGRIKVLEIVG